MKLTKSKLKQLIKEELQNVLLNENYDELPPEEAVERVLSDAMEHIKNAVNNAGGWEKNSDLAEAHALIAHAKTKVLDILLTRNNQ
jgi:DNA-binding MurR/RpiR family transcriptional regulator